MRSTRDVEAQRHLSGRLGPCAGMTFARAATLRIGAAWGCVGLAASAPGERGVPSDETGRFVAAVLGDTEDRWTEIFRENGQQYAAPRLIMFSGATSSACGMAQSAMGPFYCPNDRVV
jgi:uncharacterized protein